MCLETGNYDNCCRLPNLPASIIWMGKSRKEEEEKKNCNILFVVRSKKKKRERGRRRSNDEASLLFSPSLIIQYIESIYNPVG